MSNTVTHPKVSAVGRYNVIPDRSNLTDWDNVIVDNIRTVFQPRAPRPSDSALSVMQIDMNIANNKAAHHTDLFSNNSLIVRRAQAFQISITFNRNYDPAQDQVQLEFTIGNNPIANDGTYSMIPLNKPDKGNWTANVLTNANSQVQMSITPNADSIVGKYRMYVVLISTAGPNRDNFQDLYILFNPWAQNDSVFYSNDAERTEYVLNQMGTIFNGDCNNVTGRPWCYGQFQDGILDACLLVLDNANMPITGRGDAVKICRQASSQVNSVKDSGVLVGNWSGDYSLGTAPTSWTGSTDILLRYAKDGAPVCYAQCWVFAGVLNTFLRCLGIPSRVVTCYNSAHDNDGRIETDIILDSNMKIDTDRTKDSIWNYHCWVEAFFARPDLPPSFGGWQVVDATPQETSDGLYRCGPAPVQAVKTGMICYAFDLPFVFGEVNSDVVFYKRNNDESLTKLFTNTRYVGKMMLTKQTGSDESWDVIDHYKYSEGSKEERITMQTAEDYGMIRSPSKTLVSDLEMKASVQNAVIGTDFPLTIDLNNKGSHAVNIQILISANVVYYTGVCGPEVFSTVQQVQMDANSNTTSVVTIHASDYTDKLVDQASLNFIIACKDDNSDQILPQMLRVSMQGPQLSIDVTGISQVNQNMFVTVNFTNPLAINMTDVTVTLEGPGVMPLKTKHYDLIAPGTSITWTEPFTPQNPGQITLVASLDCAALRQVCGKATVNIDS